MARFQRDCLQDKRFESKKKDKQIIDGKLQRPESRWSLPTFCKTYIGTSVSIPEYRRHTRCRCSNAKFYINSEKEKPNKKLKIDPLSILKRIFRKNLPKDQTMNVFVILYPLYISIYPFAIIRSISIYQFLSVALFCCYIFDNNNFLVLNSLLYQLSHYPIRKVTPKALFVFNIFIFLKLQIKDNLLINC